MKDKYFEKWKATRARGKNNFIFYFGVLHYGVFMFVFLTFVMPTFRNPDSFLLTLLVTIVIFSAPVSYLWHKVILQFLEKNYLKSIAWIVSLSVFLILVYFISGVEILIPPIEVIATGLVIWGVGGLLLGSSMWGSSEGRYQDECERRKTDCSAMNSDL